MSEQADLFYETLIDQYLDASGVIARDWLTAEIRSRLEKPSCRFVLLTGEPGAGKTGLMAALARSNPGWLRYFIRSDSTTPLSGADPVSLLLRIGHQLAYRRPDIFDPELLSIEVEQRVKHAQAGAVVVGVRIEDLTVSPFYRTAIRVQQSITTLAGGLVGIEIARATVEPRLLELETLSHLALLDPALVLARKQPGETIVVLIDALDEVLGGIGVTTILDWLERLPEPASNLRFVFTSRPDPRLEGLVGVRGASLELIRIEAESTLVTNDVRRFATRLFEETGALSRNARNIYLEVAVTSIARVALGNFAYLSAYARSLRAALASGAADQLDDLLQFDKLPAGLEQLSIAFARRMRRQIEKLGQLEIESPRTAGDESVPAWEGVGQRFLGVLVVAFAPLMLEQLVALGSVRVWSSAAGNVLQCLIPFLDETSAGWKLFHPSLGEVLSQVAKKAAPDIAIDAREWHTRIVRHYQHGMPWTDVDWRAMDSYGLLHVAQHLAATQADPAALCELVTDGLRTALKERFFSDLPFRRVLETARGRIRETKNLSSVLVEGIFLQLVQSGLAAGAERLAPAVYGLMARLGRVEEALARTQVLEPGLHRYRAVEAIWRSTPATLRGALGPMDGVELLIGAAIEVPPTHSPMPGFLGMDFNDCICDAAIALVPHDMDRALRLVALAEPDDRTNLTLDRFLKDAVVLVTPERALDLLSQMSSGQSRPAVSAAEKVFAGPDRDRLIAVAREHLEEEESSQQGPLLARIITLLSADRSDHARQSIVDLRSMLEKWVATQSASSGAWGVVQVAETLHSVDAELASSILKSCDRPEVDTLLSSTLVDAARVWAAWGQPEECRLRINRALDEFRTRGWYGPAHDIVDAAIIVSRFDPKWADALAEEAIALVEPELKTSDRFGRSKLDLTLSQMVHSFREWDRARALKIARWTTGGWIRGGPWDSTDGRTSALAMIGLDAAHDDPALAGQLLVECIGEEQSAVRLGRPDARFGNYGLFRTVPHGSETNQPSLERSVNFIAYLTNSVNYWVSGLKWRFFDTPASVLRSVEATNPASASWARVVASAVIDVARVDLARGTALAFWPADAAERLIGLAALTVAFDDTDPKAQLARAALVATLKEVPQYEPEVDLSSVPQAPVLFYLNPAFRAQFEAECLMPESDGPYRLLPNIPETALLQRVLHAERFSRGLFAGIYSQMAPDDLEQQLDAVLSDYGEDFPVLNDLLNSAAAFALASGGSQRVKARLEKISHPSIRTTALLRCLPALLSAGESMVAKALAILRGMDDDILSLHRAEIAAIAIDVCRLSNDSADIGPVFEWGLQQLEGGDPLMITRGLVALSPVAPEAQRATLLERALRVSDRIGNPYMRSDAIADLLGPAVQLKNTTVVSKSLEHLLDHGWTMFMEGIRRAMPWIVPSVGPEVMERLDGAMRGAQAVLGTPTEDATGPDHLDGVLTPVLREQALQVASESVDESAEDYLATFLEATDLPPSLHFVQDTRFQGPDENDDSFARLHGQQSGFSAWQGDHDQTVWRIVDIRFLFNNTSDAAAYHRERLTHNSEGRPVVTGAPSVGEECHVFGGKQSMRFGKKKITMTNFFYIFRLGRVVVKLFVAQGVEARQPLTPDHVRKFAECIAAKIRASPFMLDSDLPADSNAIPD